MNDPKDLVIVAGPNGSGKTTFARNYLRLRPLTYLSADDIAARISPKQPDLARIEAGREFSSRVRKLVEAGESFLLESTLSGRSLQRVFEKAESKGYKIEIIFMFLESPEVCLNRIRERVRSGGHDVPEEDVRRRFSRSMRNFWEIYRQYAHIWYLFYNSERSLRMVAFGQGERSAAVDEDLFSRFRQDLEPIL